MAMLERATAQTAAPGRRLADRAREAAALNERFALFSTEDMLRALVEEEAAGRPALVPSFGAESAVLLHMAAQIDRSVPVIFIDTGKLFPATHDYREELADRLGLRDVRVAAAPRPTIRRADANADLWRRDPDRCCGLRKVAPLVEALHGFEAWVSGRKRYQGGARSRLALVEADGPRLKVNPLAHWSREEVAAYRRRHGLPEHPLVAYGYRSIGCVPCTDQVATGEQERAGRWRGMAKTECGIHLGVLAQQTAVRRL